MDEKQLNEVTFDGNNSRIIGREIEVRDLLRINICNGCNRQFDPPVYPGVRLL
jgi:hypothetical protein